MGWLKWFREIHKGDVGIAGGKGANLGELYNANFPIPPGFIVSADAYKEFISLLGIDKEINKKLEGLDVEDSDELDKVSEDIKELFMKADVPSNFVTIISNAYKNLQLDSGQLEGINHKALELVKAGRDLPFVAVRSSATAEDLPEASFAGQQSTFLNIKGSDNLIEAVKGCWASLFTPRAIYYREKNNFPHNKVAIAVIVQQMVDSIVSGVMFSVNPATSDESQIVIEGAFGLGESVVGGELSPNEYILDKQTGKLVDKKQSKQEWMYTRDYTTGKTVKKKIPQEKWYNEKLSADMLKLLWSLAVRVEKHYGCAQDMEWAFDRNRLYLVQSRPVTTLKKHEDVKEIEMPTGEPILTGLGASPGGASGPVKIILSPHELSNVKKGDVMVTKMTNPDMVPAMQRAVAIVTDEGGVTSHAAIVSREMGTPCIVGTEKATSVLHDGQIITVNGSKGEVYEGSVEVEPAQELEEPVEIIPTNIKVKVVIDLPDYAERAARQKPDGVGLLRLEGIIASGQKHPAQFMREGDYDGYVDLIADGIRKIAKVFEGKPVWVRTSDIRSDEFRNIKGGEQEPEEANPMMGWHGIRRSLDEPQILKAEFEAIKRVNDEGYDKVGVMLPQIISADEVKEAKKVYDEVGLNCEFGVMIETPGAALTIEKICDVGIDFISFGTNDLTQFTLGVDRNNSKVQKLYSEMHPAILREIAHVIKTCRAKGVKTSICGQAGSKPEMAKFLVKEGITSISASPDAVQTVRKVVAKEENEAQSEF
ncbi:MAG: phosphoenolpyruvate synthase [Candidatus Woesearchaeota archaeon]|nr:MAG: phosphoenolpyruvate synthase [Candidatus Woesearchaeota archaeon]